MRSFSFRSNLPKIIQLVTVSPDSLSCVVLTVRPHGPAPSVLVTDPRLPSLPTQPLALALGSLLWLSASPWKERGGTCSFFFRIGRVVFQSLSSEWLPHYPFSTPGIKLPNVTFLVEHAQFPTGGLELWSRGFLNPMPALFPQEAYTKPPLQLEQLILSLCMWFSFLMLFLTSWPWHMLFPKFSIKIPFLHHMACPINVSSLSA